MTDKVLIDRSVLEQALEALTNCVSEYGHRCNRCDSEVDPEAKVASALRAALVQPQVEQEPYAWMSVGGTIWRHKTCADDVPLYSHPQPPRQPLTDGQKDSITHELNMARCNEKRIVGNGELTERIVRAIERAHGIGGE